MMKPPPSQTHALATVAMRSLELSFPGKVLGEAQRTQWLESLSKVANEADADAETWKRALDDVVKNSERWPSVQRIKAALETASRSPRNAEHAAEVQALIDTHGIEFLAMGVIPSDEVCPLCVDIYGPRGVDLELREFRHEHLTLTDFDRNQALWDAHQLAATHDPVNGTWRKRERLRHRLKEEISLNRTPEYERWYRREIHRHKLQSQSFRRRNPWTEEDINAMVERYEPDLSGFDPEIQRNAERRAMELT